MSKRALNFDKIYEVFPVKLSIYCLCYPHFSQQVMLLLTRSVRRHLMTLKEVGMTLTVFVSVNPWKGRGLHLTGKKSSARDNSASQNVLSKIFCYISWQMNRAVEHTTKSGLPYGKIQPAKLTNQSVRIFLNPIGEAFSSTSFLVSKDSSLRDRRISGCRWSETTTGNTSFTQAKSSPET